jgi:hypothetical protein
MAVIQDQEIRIAKPEVKVWRRYLQALEKGLLFCISLLENTESPASEDDLDLCWRILGVIFGCSQLLIREPIAIFYLRLWQTRLPHAFGLQRL